MVESLAEDSVQKSLNIDPRYRNSGVRVRMHYYLSQRNWEKLAIKCTLKNKQAVVRLDDESEARNDSPFFHDKQFSKAKAGQIIQFDTNGRIKLGNRGSGMGTDIEQSSYFRVIENFEFVWLKDLYSPFFNENAELSMKIEIFGKPSGSNGASKMIGYCEKDINKPANG